MLKIVFPLLNYCYFIISDYKLFYQYEGNLHLAQNQVGMLPGFLKALLILVHLPKWKPHRNGHKQLKNYVVAIFLFAKCIPKLSVYPGLWICH